MPAKAGIQYIYKPMDSRFRGNDRAQKLTPIGINGYKRCYVGDLKFNRKIVFMGKCQLMNGCGQTRHMYMVLLTYSVLMRQLRQGRASELARERLTTIGQACMSVLRQTPQ